MMEKGTYFIDHVTQPKNTEFKLMMGMKTESEPIPCKILATENGKVMIEYNPGGTETNIKWINEEQIITV
jgi:hypothetical protein